MDAVDRAGLDAVLIFGASASYDVSHVKFSPEWMVAIAMPTGGGTKCRIFNR
jgi:hypothetical protein